MKAIIKIVLIPISVIVLTSCSSIDPKTEEKLDSILESDDFEFNCQTYHGFSMGYTEYRYTRIHRNRITFTSNIDTEFSITTHYSDVQKELLREIVVDGIIENEPISLVTYTFQNSTDTLSFKANGLFDQFLEIGFLNVNKLDSINYRLKHY